MKKCLAFFLTMLMILSVVPALPVYAWNKTATYPNGLTGVAAGNAQDVIPLWDNTNFANWQDVASPFTFDTSKYAPGKITGKLPMMGFNTWNYFASAINEDIIKGIADSFIRLGLDKVGYEYVGIDDGCYNRSRLRGEDGKLIPALASGENPYFQSGFKALADYIHSLGLKISMYNDVGTMTCNGLCVSSWGFEDLDAMTYAEWGIDYIKYDYCNNPWAAAPNLSAPNIRSIKVSGSDDYSIVLNAVNDGVIGPGTKSYPGQTGMSAAKNAGNYVTGLTCNTGANGTAGDLTFTVTVPAAGTYDLSVEYVAATDATNRWLQTDVNGVRVIDGKLPNTGSSSNWTYSAPTQVSLNAGDNTVRLYNEKRREIGMEQYSAFFDALQKAKAATGKDIVYSLCEWGNTQPWLWAWKVGDSWRTTGDITYTWSSMLSVYSQSVILDEYAGLDKGWNDPDMLEVGNNRSTSSSFLPANFKENESHFNLWCMMNSPLLLGNDLRQVEYGDDVWKIITNKDAIALNQDPLGVQAKRVKITQGTTSPDPRVYTSSANRVDYLVKPLANNDLALMMTNFANAETPVTASITIDEMINGTSQWGVGIGSKMVDKDAFASSDYYVLFDIGAKSKAAVVISKDTPISVDLIGHASKTFRIIPFESGDNFITITTEANDDITAEYGINNADGFKAQMVLAVYDENMVLQSVDFDAFTVEAPYYYGAKTIPNPGLLWTVKAFIWDMDFIPLCLEAVHLIPDADRSALRAAIDTALALDLGTYTRLTADRLMTALDAAQAVYNETKLSQMISDEAASALNAAINGLVRMANSIVYNGESYVRLTGNIYGQSGTWGSGRTFDLMFDGNISTFYDAVNAGDGYGGIDLGEGNESNVDLIRFYPRPDSYYTRANSCTFRGSNTISTGGNTGTLLYTISGVTGAAWYTATPVNTTDKFRYIWFMSGASSQGNISEVEFYVKGEIAVDRSLLDDRITYAGTLTAADYTGESWAEMQSALLTAINLPEDASQAQVDSAANSLKAALASLVSA